MNEWFMNPGELMSGGLLTSQWQKWDQANIMQIREIYYGLLGRALLG